MSKHVEWLTAYVEKCMVEAWGDDADQLGSHHGVVTFRVGTAACIVRVEDGEPVMARVMAKAVLGCPAVCQVAP